MSFLLHTVSLQPEHLKSPGAVERCSQTAESEVVIVEVDEGKGRAKEDEGESVY
jgi:hypothetical protein